MKKLFSILMMAIAMLTFSISTLAQAPTKKQRISREQLAEKQAQHIANSLAFDDKTRSQFVDTYTQCQKEIWALGSHPRRNMAETEAQTELQIKQRFEKSEKILEIRQKYYKKYSQFLTQRQIQRVYELERQMMKRFAQKRKQNGGKPGMKRTAQARRM